MGKALVIITYIGRQIFSVHTGNVFQWNSFGTFHLTSPSIGTVSKAFFVHLFNIFNTRSVASTCPCGSKAYCDTFAETNNMAEAFYSSQHKPHNQYKWLHQRPYRHLLFQLVLHWHLGVSIDRNKTTSMLNPIKGSASTTKSLITGKGFAQARYGWYHHP